MGPLREIIAVHHRSCTAIRRGICVPGVQYVVVLTCGHEQKTKVYARGTDHPVPKRGRRKRCLQCPEEG